MQIKLRHRVTSKQNLIHGIENYIYQKYYNEEYNCLNYGGKQILTVAPVTADNVFDTIKNYVNDAIGYKMEPEQPIKYNDLFFGTADAISFRDNFLRIHDLKTGISGEMEQLEIYTALFCLEYDIKPADINVELRLYKQNEVVVHTPSLEDIVPIIDIIVSDSKLLEEVKERGGWNE